MANLHKMQPYKTFRYFNKHTYMYTYTCTCKLHENIIALQNNYKIERSIDVEGKISNRALNKTKIL